MKGYRPDIEGLRAIAILLVVAAHAGVPGLQGGFIGVDIFFVVSGYLITGLLVGERERAGHIDLARFYARRFRRLLPALLLMLTVTALACYLILPASDQRDQAVAGAAAALWLSNMHFAFSNVDYFGASAETNLYLHTWSLGVEEQFYLVWPALIGLLLVSRSKPMDSSTRRLVRGMVVVGMASLVACVWFTAHAAHLAFYLMPTRAWQFAAGALVLLLAKRSKTPAPIAQTTPLASIARNWSGVSGLALIACTLWVVDATTPYPGAWAILPTLGTVLLITAGCTDQSNLVTAWLSKRPMQAIGHVSYSWYLWHWPILVLGQIVFPAHGLSQRLALVGLSLLLAVASYRWIEAPVRRNDRIVRRPSLMIAGSLVVMALAVAGCTHWMGTTDSQLSATTPDGKSPHRIETPIIYSMGCDDWYSSADLKPCEFGNPEATQTAVVIGDSIGLQWFPALERIFKNPDWRLVVLTKSSCPMVDRPIYYPRIGREYTECALWRERALNYIAKLNPEMVVMGSSHTAAYTGTEWVQGTQSVLARLAPHAKKIAILRSTPALPFSGPTCLGSKTIARSLMASEDICSSPSGDPQSERVAGWITEAALPWPNVHMINMNDLVCPDGICHAELSGLLVFRDTQHLNALFAATLAGPLAQRLGLDTPPDAPWDHASPSPPGKARPAPP